MNIIINIYNLKMRYLNRSGDKEFVFNDCHHENYGVSIFELLLL